MPLLPYSTEMSRSPDTATAIYQYRPTFPSSDLPTSEPDIDEYPTPRPVSRRNTLKRDSTAFSDPDDEMSLSQDAYPAPSRYHKKRFHATQPPKFNPVTYQLDAVRRIIEQAIEDSRTSIDLQGMHLTSLPSDIVDLRHIVSASQSGSFTTHLELFLGHNRLTTLPESLFDISNIAFLGLSDNRLESLSPSISKLTNLISLNIGLNQIDFLPANLLKLTRLEQLIFHSCRIDSSPTRSQRSTREHAHLSEPPKTITLTRTSDKFSRVTSLYELAMRVVAKHDYWSEVSDDYLDATGLSSQAIHSIRNPSVCDECERVMCNVFATREEVWSGFVRTEGLPIRRNVCSLNCLDMAPKYEPY